MQGRDTDECRLLPVERRAFGFFERLVRVGDTLSLMGLKGRCHHVMRTTGTDRGRERYVTAR